MVKIEITKKNFEALLEIQHIMQSVSVNSLNTNDVITNLVKKFKIKWV